MNGYGASGLMVTAPRARRSRRSRCGGRLETHIYPRKAKLGFLVGLALWTVGALGGVVGPALFAPLPGWKTMLLADAEVLGVLAGLLSSLVFGVVLPLVG